MIRFTLIAILCAGCAAPPPDAGQAFDALMLGAEVPRAEWGPVAAEVAACLGLPGDLPGWRVWEVADATPSCSGPLSFPCDVPLPACEATPPPAGHTDAECPCRCQGLTDHVGRRIAVAPDRGALRHEFVHALTGRHDENQLEFRCSAGLAATPGTGAE